MTIAQAFNEIAVAQGGTASTSGTITGAIDALNDALAGSDQQAAQTIEDAVRLLGANIGSGGGGGGGDATEYAIMCYSLENEPIESHLYPAAYNVETYNYMKDPSYTGAALTSAAAGSVLIWDGNQEVIHGWYDDIDDEDSEYYGVLQPVMVTPAKNIDVIAGRE